MEFGNPFSASSKASTFLLLAMDSIKMGDKSDGFWKRLCGTMKLREEGTFLQEIPSITNPIIVYP